MFKNNKLLKGFLGFWIFTMILSLSGIGVLGWVAFHFLSKVW